MIDKYSTKSGFTKIYVGKKLVQRKLYQSKNGAYVIQGGEKCYIRFTQKGTFAYGKNKTYKVWY